MLFVMKAKKITPTGFLVPGFSFTGTAQGIKADVRKKDVALIYSSEPTTLVAGVFTLNKVCAAPVKLCRENLKTARGRLVVVNSGCANAATGQRGLKDAKEIVGFAAKTFGLSPDEVFVCSTGRIGMKLPVGKVKAGIIAGKARLHPEGFRRAGQAILTTDAYEKNVFYSGRLGGKKFSIAVMAKGAGMIHPNMATMLCYVMTDLKFERAALQSLLQEAVNPTLNSLTVDGDTSTNDTVLLLANGMAGNVAIKTGSAAYRSILKILTAMLEDIAYKIALDGEGATKCMRISVRGAKNPDDAKKTAKAIGNSPLVKTAVFGCDPNWGRILSAAGNSGADVFEEKTTIRIGGLVLFSKGAIHEKNAGPVNRYLKDNRRVMIDVVVGAGSGKARVLASDLTYDYVRLNADYHT